MSDSKRATIITVGAPKSAKNNVAKTLRLTINLDESNESKYPELNYKELVITEERKKRIQNGKTAGLDPFSDNDDDVERVARKFEQKYSGKSTYGKKGRSKQDEFADIGAGYDENDSFIDNTDGYDEMIPPECDTLYGGFYINCGSLEFKQVPENQLAISDGDPNHGRRNKRRISSSSSEEESSDSSSESSQDEKDPKAIANGAVDSHNTEHRKKKNKKTDKKKPKKVRRTDSSAATSGKQTSDDNGHGEGESVDSRTSQSDSMTSKPAPSSENPITSDSSRDAEGKTDIKIPQPVSQVLEELEAVVSKLLIDNLAIPTKEIEMRTEQHVARLERAICKCNADSRVRRVVWTKAAKVLNVSRAKLMQRAKALCDSENTATQPTATSSIPQAPPSSSNTNNNSANNKRKYEDNMDNVDYSNLSPEEREAKIVETLNRLKELIEERIPAMMANYNAECERVQEERKKLQIASAEGSAAARAVEKRLPKRRFPWCGRARALLARLARLAGERRAAAALLAARALPLFPRGFVRMPTLLRQADLNKEMKSDQKKQRTASQPPLNIPTQTPIQLQTIQESIQFPSSLTVTTSVKNSIEKTEIAVGTDNKDKKSNSVFGAILNSFNRPDIIVEPGERKKESVIIEKNKEDHYVPPNSIGSITITPVPNNQQKNDKRPPNNAVTVLEKQKEPLIRVKSPAALNEMAKKEKEKRDKKVDKNVIMKEKKIDTPLQVDTSYQPNKVPTPSPKSKAEEISQKKIENMRISENNIPRPALIPVHHSPTFAKPDKRPPEIKKKKDVVIVSDVDPLADVHQELVSVDDSSSDVEVIEDKNVEKSEHKSDSVPSKDKVSVHVDMNHKKTDNVKHSSKDHVTLSGKDSKVESAKNDKLDEATKEDIDTVMRNLREMEHSQESTKFNSNSYGGVITSAKQKSSNHSRSVFGETQNDKNKLMNFFKRQGWM